MNIIFNLLGVAAFGYGMLLNSMAKSAIHEIEAFMMFLIAAVLIVGGELSSKLDRIKILHIAGSENVNKSHGQEIEPSRGGYLNE